MILKKLLAIAIMALSLGLINSAYARKTPHIVIYQDKNVNSKHVGKLKNSTDLEKIIPFYQKKKWIKVGSTKTGKVGWIHKEHVEKFYEHQQESRKRQLSYEEPMVSVDYKHHQSSCILDGRWIEVIDSNTARFVTWYDNEWGYTGRFIEAIKYISSFFQ